jgi:hypothetical protein
MADYEQTTLRVQLARDANQVDVARWLDIETSNTRNYARLDEIRLAGGSSTTIVKVNFTAAGNIETLIVNHKTTTGTGVKVEFTDAGSNVVAHRVSPGDWAKFTDVASDVTLTNMAAGGSGDIEVELYGAT